MKEYRYGKVIVRIHGEANPKKLEQACVTYLNNIMKKGNENDTRKVK